MNFSDELPALKHEVQDYVIVHELLHFFVPNHGRLWKSLMRVHLGDYERIEGVLRKNDDGSGHQLIDRRRCPAES
jgi:predicted metal-dependent hydrolase